MKKLNTSVLNEILKITRQTKYLYEVTGKNRKGAEKELELIKNLLNDFGWEAELRSNIKYIILLDNYYNFGTSKYSDYRHVFGYEIGIIVRETKCYYVLENTKIKKERVIGFADYIDELWK